MSQKLFLFVLCVVGLATALLMMACGGGSTLGHSFPGTIKAVGVITGVNRFDDGTPTPTTSAFRITPEVIGNGHATDGLSSITVLIPGEYQSQALTIAVTDSVSLGKADPLAAGKIIYFEAFIDGNSVVAQKVTLANDARASEVHYQGETVMSVLDGDRLDFEIGQILYSFTVSKTLISQTETIIKNSTAQNPTPVTLTVEFKDKQGDACDYAYLNTACTGTITEIANSSSQ